MCETKAALVSLSLILLVAATLCIYQEHTENEMRHHSIIKIQCPCENEYKKYCLDGGKCYYVIDADIIVCNCTW